MTWMLLSLRERPSKRLLNIIVNPFRWFPWSNYSLLFFFLRPSDQIFEKEAQIGPETCRRCFWRQRYLLYYLFSVPASRSLLDDFLSSQIRSFPRVKVQKFIRKRVLKRWEFLDFLRSPSSLLLSFSLLSLSLSSSSSSSLSRKQSLNQPINRAINPFPSSFSSISNDALQISPSKSLPSTLLSHSSLRCWSDRLRFWICKWNDWRWICKPCLSNDYCSTGLLSDRFFTKSHHAR